FPLQDQITGKNALDALVEHLESGKQQIYLVGHAGQGKTILARALVHELASRHNLDALTSQSFFGEKDLSTPSVSVRIADLEVFPPHPVVIFMQMRRKFENLSQFESALVHSFSPDFTEKWDTIRPFFRIPGSRWIIILDALDELYNREDFVPGLNNWLNQLPSNVQVVVSARPYAVPHVEKTVLLSFLSDEQTSQLLMKKLRDESRDTVESLQEQLVDLIGWDFEKIESQVDAWLCQNPEIIDIIRTPRAIDAVVRAVFQEVSLLEVDQSLEPAESTYFEDAGHSLKRDDTQRGESTSNNEVSNSISNIPSFYSDEDVLAIGDTDDTLTKPQRMPIDRSIKVVGVRFIEGGKIYHFDASAIDHELSEGDIVRVQTKFGKIFGKVVEDRPDNVHGQLQPVLQWINPNHPQELDFTMPTNATLVARVVDYLRESEKDRQKELGLETTDIVERAKDALDRLAWKKDWHSETFDWLTFQEILDDASRKWNEYIGFITRTGKEREYRFRSLYFLAFCAAEYAFETRITTWRMLGVLGTLFRKWRHRAFRKVAILWSEFLYDNGRLSPIFRRLVPWLQSKPS
ncbi:MAG: NACHT domain-containing protein, partial [Methanobacteriota archaeon]